MNPDLMRISQIISLIDSKTRKNCEKCSRKLSQKRKNPICVKCSKSQKIQKQNNKNFEIRDSGEIKEILSNDHYDNSRKYQSELDSSNDSNRLAKEKIANEGLILEVLN